MGSNNMDQMLGIIWYESKSFGPKSYGPNIMDQMIWTILYGSCHLVHILWSMSFGPYYMVHRKAENWINLFRRAWTVYKPWYHLKRKIIGLPTPFKFKMIVLKRILWMVFQKGKLTWEKCFSFKPQVPPTAQLEVWLLDSHRINNFEFKIFSLREDWQNDGWERKKIALLHTQRRYGSIGCWPKVRVLTKV